MDPVLPSWAQLAVGVGAVASAALAVWSLWTKAKKSIKHAIIDAVDDKFASRQDIKRVEGHLGRLEEHMEATSFAVQTMTYQTSRILDQLESKSRAK